MVEDGCVEHHINAVDFRDSSIVQHLFGDGTGKGPFDELSGIYRLDDVVYPTEFSAPNQLKVFFGKMNVDFLGEDLDWLWSRRPPLHCLMFGLSELEEVQVHRVDYFVSHEAHEYWLKVVDC